MFRASIRNIRPLRLSHSLGPLRPLRNYSSSNPRNEPPKLKYIAAIALLGSVAFVLSANSLDKKAPKKEITEEEYQQEKNSNKLRYKKSAFTNIDVVFMVGCDGSGKTTQCENLSKNNGFIHLNMQNLLKNSNSKYGEIASRFVEENKQIPEQVLTALLHEQMVNQVKQGNKKFVIEGFPTSIPQAMKFEEDVAVSKVAIYLECPEKELVKRLAGGAAQAEKEFSEFSKSTLPLINYLDTADRVVRVSCNQSADKVHQHIIKYLEKYQVL